MLLAVSFPASTPVSDHSIIRTRYHAAIVNFAQGLWEVQENPDVPCGSTAVCFVAHHKFVVLWQSDLVTMAP